MTITETAYTQAAGLSRFSKRRPVKVIAVTSGKGGVGKSNVCINLAVAFATLGRRVFLLDADMSLANIDVLLGLHANKNLSHVLKGDTALRDIILQGPEGINIVPAASGLKNMADLAQSEIAGLIHAFSDIQEHMDVLIIDTAAGLSQQVISFCRAAQEVVVVACDEPTSITDAYATIKVLSRDYQVQRFHVIANKVRTAQGGKVLFEKLVKVADRFLDVNLSHGGSIPYDECVIKAIQRQKSVIELYPRSRAANAFKNLAKRVDNWPVTANASGHLQFFIEQLIAASHGNTEAAI